VGLFCELLGKEVRIPRKTKTSHALMVILEIIDITAVRVSGEGGGCARLKLPATSEYLPALPCAYVH